MEGPSIPTTDPRSFDPVIATMAHRRAPERQTSSPGGATPPRRVALAERLEGEPKHFAQDGNLILSHLAAAMSTIFPDGEEFFVAAVRHYRDEITDPDLRRQV